jgi:hypothetical protein
MLTCFARFPALLRQRSGNKHPVCVDSDCQRVHFRREEVIHEGISVGHLSIWDFMKEINCPWVTSSCKFTESPQVTEDIWIVLVWQDSVDA